jgi:pSer/pThr/pTyr-binding forkhead associated (FHA) protein
VPTAPAPTQVGSLLFMFDTGQRETVVSPGSGYLGRNPTATSLGEQVISVQDPDKSVSKVHLHFEARGAQLWITDQGSTNGTDLIDDEGQVVALEAGERVEVPAGSRVRLGDRTFAVSVIHSS